MEWLGELERTFATSLYPLRVPIAIGLATAIIAGIVVAARRGWFGAARRHPGRSAGLALASLVVVGPIAWYLGSPLFVRTALIEPAPITGAVASPGFAGPEASNDPAMSGAPPAESIAPPDLAVVRTGTFEGADEFHFASGEARLLETAPGEWVVRFEDFSVRNGPNLHVYLSPDPEGYADGVIELGGLKATDGSFNTKVPAGADVAGARSVVIWCKQFAVQFAVAELR